MVWPRSTRGTLGRDARGVGQQALRLAFVRPQIAVPVAHRLHQVGPARSQPGEPVPTKGVRHRPAQDRPQRPVESVGAGGPQDDDAAGERLVLEDEAAGDLAVRQRPTRGERIPPCQLAGETVRILHPAQQLDDHDRVRRQRRRELDLGLAQSVPGGLADGDRRVEREPADGVGLLHLLAEREAQDRHAPDADGARIRHGRDQARRHVVDGPARRRLHLGAGRDEGQPEARPRLDPAPCLVPPRASMSYFKNVARMARCAWVRFSASS